MLLSPGRHGANASFGAAIIAWRPRRRIQTFDGELVQDLPRRLGNEGRSVVAFQHQGREQPIKVPRGQFKAWLREN
jgi:hypothetical protein